MTLPANTSAPPPRQPVPWHTVSDFDPADGRPTAPLPSCIVEESVYVFHHDGLIGLEVGTFGADGRSPEVSVTLGLTAEQARYLARELASRADELADQKR